MTRRLLHLLRRECKTRPKPHSHFERFGQNGPPAIADGPSAFSRHPWLRTWQRIGGMAPAKARLGLLVHHSLRVLRLLRLNMEALEVVVALGEALVYAFDQQYAHLQVGLRAVT